MAKKDKAPLTPEQAEVKAIKRNRRSDNFLRFLACLLALVLTFGVVNLGKKAATKDEPANGEEATESTETTKDPFADLGDDKTDDPATPGDNSGDKKDDPATPGNDGGDKTDEKKELSKADAVKLLNDLTASAAKGNYTWTRKCAYTPDGKIKVTSTFGDATKTLNSFIQSIAKDQTLESVVGNFIGIGEAKADIKGGKFQGDDEWRSTNYLIKAMSLTEGDVVKFASKGTTYLYQLTDCNDPQKDGKNPLSKATDDFLTETEVRAALDNELTKVGMNSNSILKTTKVNYESILIKATIDNGKLTAMNISYTFSAELNLKVLGVAIDGTGKATTDINYTNIAY